MSAAGEAWGFIGKVVGSVVGLVLIAIPIGFFVMWAKWIGVAVVLGAFLAFVWWSVYQGAKD